MAQEEPARIAEEDEESFQRALEAHPRCIVMFRGASCGYSTRFLPVFEGCAPPEGWRLLVRGVEHGGEGPHGERHDIEVTPTVVAYREGRPVARLPGEVGIGIRAEALQDFLRKVADAQGEAAEGSPAPTSEPPRARRGG